MKVSPTAIPGVLVLEPAVFEDGRGFLFESYNKRVLAEGADG
jgi:dTDP-4-dehydrorhamnose 3,5-epimerase